MEGTPTLAAAVNFRPEYQAELGATRRSTAACRWRRSGSMRPRSCWPTSPAPTASLDGLAELIHERTGGNPFFIEEVVRELVEAGNLEGGRGAYRLTRPDRARPGSPATVQAILAARIDRLAAAKAAAPGRGGDRQRGP